MEKSTRPKEKENPSLQISQRNPSTTTSSSSNGNNTNTNTTSHGIGETSPSAAAAAAAGGGCGGGVVVAGLPLTPKTTPRSETNPYPTTFIQADTSSFKQVVQMLTGSSETAAKHAVAARSAPSALDPHTRQQQPPPPPPLSRNPIPPAKTGPKRPAFKLYERRQSSFKGLKINPLVPGLFNSNSSPNSPIPGFSPRYKPEILSPSILDFPSLVLSPVTPLIPDPFNRPPLPPPSISAEDRAIAEKGFYLHPSPRPTTPRDTEPPRLLPLFPVTSPRLAASSPAANSSN